MTLRTKGSRLLLPVRRQLDDTLEPFQAPESAEPLALEEVRAPENSREFSQEDGVSTVTIYDDFGEYKDLTHGLINGSIGREVHTIEQGAPLSARSRTHWTQTYSREDGWSIRTETFQEMWADETHFHITARMEAYEGKELIYEKDWVDELIERKFV